MQTTDPASPHPLHSERLWQHGFTEAGSERLLGDMARLAAAFCGAPAVLALGDPQGIWYCEGAGLAAEDLAALEPILGRAFQGEDPAREVWGLGFHFLDERRLAGPQGEGLGCLWVLAPEPSALTASQQAGLALLASQIAALVVRKGEQAEHRKTSRGPSGASFVPGLVHELRNFIFGITASLDAFQARFSEQPETLRYGQVMRASVERLNAFVGELREYGDPHLAAWADRPLEPLLREALAHHGPRAQRDQVDLRLQILDPLPAVRMDEESLRTAFIHLLELALEQESPGGCLVVHVGTRTQGERPVVFGHLDGSGLKLQGLDLARLFEPFYFRPAGLGRLGLPVARRIFEAHGGNLGASPGPEGGLRMGFMLPAV